MCNSHGETRRGQIMRYHEPLIMCLILAHPGRIRIKLTNLTSFAYVELYPVREDMPGCGRRPNRLTTIRCI